ncbi:glutathione S-transferase N-terminal domain-containing protein [Ruegeria lacuscaerulensis]|uniref:glutathione S-transferase N-terminal domain-containing protein n=1 Tax=Ruegeria lacuscaerulensis TaxID=55218 RepID=UPI00147CFA25|nr:glutathione S-transferase N-terminal domain-containing protein [Ruegeria lacuscaerulensis]
MTLTIHTISGAPRPWRVLVALALKGIPYEQHVLKASAGEHKSEPFLSLNPRGTVPVVEADGIVIRDSIAALAWLDRRYPEPPLFGATPDDAARIWQITMEACDYMREASHAVLAPVLLRHLDPEIGSEEEKALIESSEKLHAECCWLESLLTDGPYLAGGALSAADAVVFPEIRLIQRAVENHHEVMDRLGFGYPPDLYPRVSDWKARMSELPGIEDTLPPHWKEQETVPSMRNYKKTLIVDAKPDQAFEALTKGFEHWWTTPDEPIRNEGDRVRFTFPPGRSYWTFEAKKLVPGKLVELECVEALHLHEGKPREIETEWLGTRTIWNISPVVNGARIRFEHVGLSPSLHCYEVCEAGWDRFFVDSLKAYLDSGTGRPHRPPV